MSLIDYVRGVGDAEMVGHVTSAARREAELARQQADAARIDSAREGATSSQQMANKALSTLLILQQRITELKLEIAADTCTTNTILEEADLCRQHPDIRPRFSASGEEGRMSRQLLRQRFSVEHATTGDIANAGLTPEEIIEYHKTRRLRGD